MRRPGDVTTYPNPLHNKQGGELLPGRDCNDLCDALCGECLFLSKEIQN
jgi:hypothetical protein